MRCKIIIPYLLILCVLNTNCSTSDNSNKNMRRNTNHKINNNHNNKVNNNSSGDSIIKNKFASRVDPLEESPIKDSYSAIGGKAFLPCDIEPPILGDSPLLIIFFKGSEPLYSIDSRDGTIGNAIHWSSPSVESKRISFKVNSPPYGLQIPEVGEEDRGGYHCRVDFVNSPTRNLRIRLHVAVPPSHLEIIDKKGEIVDKIAGPFPLGDSVSFTCRVNGGTPRPKVTWLHDGVVIDQTIEELKEQITSNSLTLPVLTRSHLGQILTCQTFTSNLTKSLSKSIEVDMYFPPEKVKFEISDKTLMAGKEYTMECQSIGSRPRANITWWKDGKQIARKIVMSSGNENLTRSSFVIVPKRIDNGSIVACRAENSFLPGTAVEESMKLLVLYPPKLTLNVGDNLLLDDIREGGDVYFECKIDANPKVNVIHWFKDGNPLAHNVTSGVVISGQSLVLQKVGRKSTGIYSCSGRNRLGSAASNDLNLIIKYSPVCLPNQREIYGATNDEAVNVSCELEGEPPTEIMHWAFNTTSELIRLKSKTSEPNTQRTIMPYVPKTHLDYGSLLCWGENKVGKQRIPCVFQIVPATPPESVRNCSAWQNISSAGMLIISCLPGWNGGLNQTFSLKIKSKPNGPTLMTFDGGIYPTFSVSNLPAGNEFYFYVSSSNSQGRSVATIFRHFTPIDIAEERLSAATSNVKEKKKKEPEKEHKTYYVTLISCISVAFTLACILLLLMFKIRRRRRLAQGSGRSQSKDEIDRSSDTDIHNQSILLITADGSEESKSEKELSAPRDSLKVKKEKVIGVDESLLEQQTLQLYERRGTSSKKESSLSSCLHPSSSTSTSSDVQKINILHQHQRPPDEEILQRKESSPLKSEKRKETVEFTSLQEESSKTNLETLESCEDASSGSKGKDLLGKKTSARKATLIKTGSGERIQEFSS